MKPTFLKFSPPSRIACVGYAIDDVIERLTEWFLRLMLLAFFLGVPALIIVAVTQ